jgi:GT2 family glycosyltransferase
MIENNSRSACPYSEISHKENKTNLTKAKEIYEGYEIRKEFCGWAFCWKRDLFEELSLDTRVSFWCSDDATAEQLKMKNEKHILVTKSIVDHYENGSKTLYSMDNNTIHNLTTEQFIKFKQLYNK